MKKLVKKIFNGITYVFIIISLLILIITISSKKNYDEKSTLFNMELRLVLTDSMEKSDKVDVSNYRIKSIPKNSLILIKKVNNETFYENVKVGDVLTFKYVYNQQVTITHRVSSIEKKEDGGYLIALIGDNQSSESEVMSQYIDTSEINSPNYVIGKVVGKSLFLGTILTIIKKPIGIIFLIIIPSFIIILLEIIKICNLINIEKRKKDLEEKTLKEKEINDLKKKLKELENKII